jgi:SPP1 family predicted phage head-tail adaptor
MQAGQLRHRIAIEAPQIVRNAYGEEVPTWVPVFTAWALREDLSGKEWHAAGVAAAAETVSRYTLRFQPGITTKHRIREGARIFNITAVLDSDGKGRTLTIITREVV